ncbi:MAG: gamma-D-glutamyl-meso-diaminopimelate peptidase, partial [Clostridia bacterium]|nr:gamma-D-glutamyl-meso-diaminopimelate peptidase [Clostridia bacterium]
ANIRGVDLNLQFPAGWEEARRIKYAEGFRTPAPRDYVGRAPLSSREASALAELTRKSDFDRVLAFHTQGGVIYWQYGAKRPEGSFALGEKLSAASGYPLAEPARSSSYAGYKDWFIDAFDRPGYTFELGNGVSPLPLSVFPDLYDRIKPALVTALAY